MPIQQLKRGCNEGEMKVPILWICTTLFACISGLPARRTIKNDDIIIEPLSISCVTATDCSPFDNYSDEELFPYVQCSNSTCLCYPCFLVNASSQTCKLDSCYEFSLEGCSTREKSQKTAFLLSLFLSPVGAANFYISQYNLGIIQASLMVLLMLVCFACCCCTCCVVMCEECSCCDIEESCCPVCVIIMLIILMCLVTISICTWWLMDLIILGLNQRDDGNGCSLVKDL